MTDTPKRRGRPKMTEAEKAEAKAKRDAAAGRDKTEAPKAPKRATARGQVSENAKRTADELTDDERLALLLDHAGKISKLEAALRTAQANLKDGRNRAKAELGKDAVNDIKLYERLQSDEGQASFRALINGQARVARWAGMPIGHMEDLFAEPDRTPVLDKMKAEGKRAGLAGEGATPPTHLTGEGQQAWLAGWHDGQAVHGAKFKATEASSRPAPVPQKFGSPPAHVDYHAMGAKAFVDGQNDMAPAIVPMNRLDDWREGYAKAKAAHEKRTAPINYKEQGARHREHGGGGAIPDSLSKEDGAIWFSGWREKDAQMRGVSLDEAS